MDDFNKDLKEVQEEKSEQGLQEVSNSELTNPEQPDDNNGGKKPKRGWSTGGGLYRGVKVPIKLLDTVIVLGVLAIVITVIILSINGGLSVTFQADGASEAIPTQRLRYGSLVEEPEDPQRIGYEFDGWYEDMKYTEKWDFSEDKVQQTTTLYAKWIALDGVEDNQTSTE